MNKSKIDKNLVLVCYFITVVTNVVAVVLPINNVTTKEVSDAYVNLFTPAGFTFSIWGIIYSLLGIFAIYQWCKPSKDSVLEDLSKATRIRYLFIASSLLNSSWLIAWQYFYIELSVLLMFALLVCLIGLNYLVSNSVTTKKDIFFLKLPFTIYLGWIIVATISNVLAFMVDKNVLLFTTHQELWTIIIVISCTILVCLLILWGRTISYGLVALWAYFGILKQHQSSTGWNNHYPIIICTIAISMFVVAICCIFEFYLQQKKHSI